MTASCRNENKLHYGVFCIFIATQFWIWRFKMEILSEKEIDLILMELEKIHLELTNTTNKGERND